MQFDPSACVGLLKTYFVARTDRGGVFPAQWIDITDIDEALRAHVAGATRLGISPFMPDRMNIRWAMVEAEDHGSGAVANPTEVAFKLKELIEAKLGAAYVEVSKGGNYHVLTFFSTPVLAATVRKALKSITTEAECPQVEVFPKQDDILGTKQDGAPKDGNFVFLPLFGGQDDGGGGLPTERTVFVDSLGQPFIPQLLETVDPARLAAFVAQPKAEQAKRGEPETNRRDDLRPGLDTVRRKCAFFKHVEAAGTNISERLWDAWISNACVFEGGTEYIHQFSAIYKPDSGKQGYSPELTNRKIERTCAPYRCETIRRHGFTGCPTGGCGVTSPACLSFKAGVEEKVTAESIRDRLNRYKASASASSGVDPLRQDFDDEEKGKRKPIDLPWKRTSELTSALRPGSVLVIGGPTGTSKTTLAANLALHLHQAGVSFFFLPLEDRKSDLLRRMLAILEKSWDIMRETSVRAFHNKQALTRHEATMSALADRIADNPRLNLIEEDGQTRVPPLPYTSVLDRIETALRTHRVVFVDPISQIDFTGKAPWESEAAFIRGAVALATKHQGNVVLVAHTVKRPGKAATVPLSVEDIQGSAMISRLCQTVILLEAHDTKNSSVYRKDGCFETVEHDRTLLIAKARHGRGTRMRLAFQLKFGAPVFEELGVIAPKDAGPGSGNVG